MEVRTWLKIWESSACGGDSSHELAGGLTGRVCKARRTEPRGMVTLVTMTSTAVSAWLAATKTHVEI